MGFENSNSCRNEIERICQNANLPDLANGGGGNKKASGKQENEPGGF